MSPEEFRALKALYPDGDPVARRSATAQAQDAFDKRDGKEKCSCPESLALRAELATVTAERDYLRGMASPDDLRVMRQELARGWLPESEQTDFDKVPG